MLGDEVDSEPAFAQVFDGGSEMIDFVIDDEEAVVGVLELMDIDGFGWVLLVVGYYCWFDGFEVTARLHIDVAGDSRVATAESLGARSGRWLPAAGVAAVRSGGLGAADR